MSYDTMNNIDENCADFDLDPEKLLNEWLGELNSLTVGLEPANSTTQLRQLSSSTESTTPTIDRYRFSMANLEETQDGDLDAILHELYTLDAKCDRDIANDANKRLSDAQKVSQHTSRTHMRSSSEGPRLKLDTAPATPADSDLMLKTDSGRTDSPDNDSAFSDTVSMLSSESSASSGASKTSHTILMLSTQQQDDASRIKAEKIRLAMEKIKEANIKKLFVKVFAMDGSSKSLLVEEKMSCSYVTRLLVDKNHVPMDPKWALVEYIPDLYMERIYEDHENLVENLMLWTRESKNRIYFTERPDKFKMFVEPEKFLLSLTDNKRDNYDYDDHSRNMLLEEFFAVHADNVPHVEGPLYLKDSKKGWKKYNFVLRASGLYYYPKEKAKSAKDLTCLTSFEKTQVYNGVGWKKKFKAPSDFCFAIKHPQMQEVKAAKYFKYLCAEDQETLERWMIGIRIAKYGRQIMDNYRSIMDELAQEDLDNLANARSFSVSSIAVQSNVTTPTQGYQSSEAGYGTQSETSYSAPSESSSGRHSRASSSSSSGCMSDGAPSSCENAFDSEFPMGTIKRKPSMKPNLPLTNMTRQLKEVGETRDEIDAANIHPASPINTSGSNSGTLTRRHSRRKSNSTDDSSNSGTLKRQHSYNKSRGSIESMGGSGGVRSGNSTPKCGTPVRERASPFTDRSFIERPPSAGSLRSPLSPTNCNNNMEMLPACMTDSITSLPPPPETIGDTIINDSPSDQLPPPPPEIYNSNLSLDSLPPPPNPNDLPPITGSELTGSQISLMSLPPPPGELDSGTIRRRKGSVTPTNALSPDRTPTMSPDQTPTQSRINTPCYTPPLSNVGSNCSTPTQLNPPCTFSPTHYGQSHQHYSESNGYQQQQPPAYVHPPSYNNNRQSNTLPNAFNNSNGLRSSLRTSLPRQISSHSIASTSSSSTNSSLINELKQQQQQNSPFNSTQRKDSASPKKTKKISFNLTPQEVPPLPQRPMPPKRSDSTKLSSPNKLADPPSEFLSDLHKVLKKKWQVAQKCKSDTTTTPHEVLGFRDPPVLLPDYKEHNVSNWVQEHYGPNNVYENIYRDNNDAVPEYARSPVHHVGNVDSAKAKRPPPPPPKRSETTHLSSAKLLH